MDEITINGRPYRFEPGISVAAAIARAVGPGFRRSVTGQVRGPLCGMGVCFECRATVDGRAHRTTCQLSCRAGMEVSTDVGSPL